jgi:hypothetical protein
VAEIDLDDEQRRAAGRERAGLKVETIQAPAVFDHSRALPLGDGVLGQRSHAARNVAGATWYARKRMSKNVDSHGCFGMNKPTGIGGAPRLVPLGGIM